MAGASSDPLDSVRQNDPFSARQSCRNSLRCSHRRQFALARTRRVCIDRRG